MAIYVVVNQLNDFKADIPGIEVITARQYIGDKRFSDLKSAQIFNLCRSYVYQNDGYYVSLLAEARGHKVMPDLTTIQDTKTMSIIRIKSGELNELIRTKLAGVKGKKFELDIMFGATVDPEFRGLGLQLFNQFPAPILRAYFKHKTNDWKLQDVDPISTNQLGNKSIKMLPQFAAEYFNTKKFKVRKPAHFKYSLAILINPDEPEPPSNKQAIKKFIKAAESLGIQASTITRDDYNHVAEYDALFIRETTYVNHHTYRFARRAAIKGLAVMDDPDSILKCTNKVYLAELLERSNIAIPKTMLIHKDNTDEVDKNFDFPIILKLPDSCLSQGVHKANNPEELKRITKEMLNRSDLIIAQEYLPTSFDWRIGIINGEPFYACKYYMARNHWQITEWTKNGETSHGAHDTVDISEVPAHVRDTALKAANLIGKGLYGVDLKEIDGKAYVIEVNDNPSIDAGVEDGVLKENLYKKVMEVFLEKIQHGVPH